MMVTIDRNQHKKITRSAISSDVLFLQQIARVRKLIKIKHKIQNCSYFGKTITKNNKRTKERGGGGGEGGKDESEKKRHLPEHMEKKKVLSVGAA